ncbi:MAG: alpha/beta hydrolase fold domain-containing protein [Pseudomonadota bacterium]
MPPAHIITAGADPLRDEGRAYTERLRASSVDVVHAEYDGIAHGFFQMAGVLEAGRDVIEEISSVIAGMEDDEA